MGAAWSLESIFHFTVTASDFERSLEFYRTLGFRVLRDNRDVIWPGYVARQLGLVEAQGRGALLAIGESEQHTRLDLIEWLAPRHPDPAASIPIERRIPRILALRTRNVRAARRELTARGIAFQTEPRGPDPETGIEAVVCCRDPDGLVVELIEYAPGVLGSRIAHLPRR